MFTWIKKLLGLDTPAEVVGTEVAAETESCSLDSGSCSICAQETNDGPVCTVQDPVAVQNVAAPVVPVAVEPVAVETEPAAPAPVKETKPKKAVKKAVKKELKTPVADKPSKKPSGGIKTMPTTKKKK